MLKQLIKSLKSWIIEYFEAFKYAEFCEFSQIQDKLSDNDEDDGNLIHFLNRLSRKSTIQFRIFFFLLLFILVGIFRLLWIGNI